MRRVLAVLVGVSLVASACGGGGSVLSQQAATPTVTEMTAAPTTPPVATVATTAVPPEPPGMSIHQVMIRYDGVTGAGTIGATVCNLQDAGAIRPEVVISANGFDMVLGGIDIAPRSCRGFFDASIDLPGFGITGPGVVPVAVTATPRSGPGEAVSTVEAVEIGALTMAAPAPQLETYRDCLASGNNHRNCVGNVPYHPIGDAGEVMEVSGRYVAIGPAAYGEVLAYFLADNRLCAPRIEDWLGTSGPDPIAHRLVVADDYGGGYTGHYVEIYSVGSESRWEEANLNVADWWGAVLDGYCSNAHEMTHLILGDTPMPSLVEEGLATYVEADARSGSGREPAAECRDHTWYGWRFEDGQGERPYEDLDAWSPDVHGIYYYYTGMCFWDYLAGEYGEATVQEIIGRTVAYRDPGFNGCGGLTGTVLFMRDIVTPILGADIGAITEDRWGFGSTFTGCEG